MDLHRKLFAREDVFDEQRQLFSCGVLKPDFSDLPICRSENGSQIVPAPRFLNSMSLQFHSFIPSTGSSLSSILLQVCGQIFKGCGHAKHARRAYSFGT
jgi:hypothetical protein